MTARIPQIVRDSYEALAASMEPFSENFYDRLFRVAPGVRAMFPEDMTRQRQHLASAVAIVARNADRIPDLAETLRDLGARHVAYGARPEHYPIVAGVLLDSLAQAAGDAWEPQTAQAWRSVIDRVCGLMVEGARASEEIPSSDRPVRAEPAH